MTQEEKQLLLKDLCARLPYGVKVERNGDVCEVLGIIDDNIILTANVPTNQQTKIVNIKPYLLPMSSMTEEEKDELSKRYVYSICGNRIYAHYHSEGYWDDDTELHSDGWEDLFNWLNSHHFDFRGLIEKGLAIEAPEGMYNTK